MTKIIKRTINIFQAIRRPYAPLSLTFLGFRESKKRVATRRSRDSLRRRKRSSQIALKTRRRMANSASAATPNNDKVVGSGTLVFEIGESDHKAAKLKVPGLA